MRGEDSDILSYMNLSEKTTDVIRALPLEVRAELANVLMGPLLVLGDPSGGLASARREEVDELQKIVTLLREPCRKWDEADARLTVHVETGDRDDLKTAFEGGVSLARKLVKNRPRSGPPVVEEATWCVGGCRVTIEFAPEKAIGA